MNDKDHAVYEALKRVEPFATAHAAAFTAGSEGAKDVARVTPLIQEIGTPKQNTGVSASAATGAKAHLFAEVREDLQAIAGTVRTIARNEPGFAATYRLGDDSQREILADAERILKELAKPGVPEKFASYSMDPDFVTDLQADLATITGKDTEQDEHQIDSVGETARVAILIGEARKLLKALNTSVTNRFRRDSEILAEWATASRIHRGPRKGSQTTAPDSPLPPAGPIG